MKTPSYKKPLNIRIGETIVAIGEVFIQLGHVRVQGWIRSQGKSAGFEADRQLAERLGVRSLGTCGYQTSEAEAVSMPFSFDMQPDFVRPSYRRENMEETLDRVMKQLRSAKWHFCH